VRRGAALRVEAALGVDVDGVLGLLADVEFLLELLRCLHARRKKETVG